MYKLYPLMLKVKFLFCFIFLLSNFVSAQSHYITETGLNTLVFTKKDELKVGYYLPSAKQGNKFLLGYSPTKFVSLEGGFIHINEHFTTGQEANFNKNYIDLSGYSYLFSAGAFRTIPIFTPSPDSINAKQIVLNTNLKAGYSSGEIETNFNRFQSIFTFQKLHVQAGIGVENPNAGFYMFLKYNQLTFKQGDITMALSESNLYNQVQELEKRDFFRMLEYKIRLHANYRAARAVLGVNFEFNIDNEESLNFLENGYPYFGLIINVHQLKNSFKKQSKTLDFTD